MAVLQPRNLFHKIKAAAYSAAASYIYPEQYPAKILSNIGKIKYTR